MQDVVNEPDNAPLRQRLVGQGATLARDIKNLRVRVDGLRRDQTVQVEDLTKEANGLIDQIDRLNPQIARLEAAGLLQSDAGALRTQRYEALQRLSEIVPASFRQRDDGGVDVFLGSDYLVLDGAKQHLETYTTPDRDVAVTNVRTTKTKSLLPDGGGELRGIIDGRDQTLGGFVDDLNLLANTLIGEVNRLHSSGEGEIGYQSVAAERAVDDANATLSAAGLPFTIKHGGFDVKVINRTSGAITTSRIAIDLDGLGNDDTTLADLTSRLNATANLAASVDPSGRLTLTAAQGYELKFGNDTSGVLAALGINGFFTGNDAASIGVRADLQSDHRLLATGRGAGLGDNRNAVALAGTLDTALASLGGQSLSGRYELAVAKIAQGSAAAKTLADGSDAYLQSLLSQRQQYSGVSLDEEAVKMIEFQHAFQSAARLISTIDELYNTLLQM